jgi:hypothetical protein
MNIFAMINGIAWLVFGICALYYPDVNVQSLGGIFIFIAIISFIYAVIECD